MLTTIKLCYCFFFNDTATTEIYTLSLHDALPISGPQGQGRDLRTAGRLGRMVQCDLSGPAGRGPWASLRLLRRPLWREGKDRKSTRLNSSHANISYAVFCLKKKTKYKYHLYNIYI